MRVACTLGLCSPVPQEKMVLNKTQHCHTVFVWHVSDLRPVSPLVFPLHCLLGTRRAVLPRQLPPAKLSPQASRMLLLVLFLHGGLFSLVPLLNGF